MVTLQDGHPITNLKSLMLMLMMGISSQTHLLSLPHLTISRLTILGTLGTSTIMKNLMMMDLGSPIHLLQLKIKMYSLAQTFITQECMLQVAEAARPARVTTIYSRAQLLSTDTLLMTDLDTDGHSIRTCKQEPTAFNFKQHGLQVTLETMSFLFIQLIRSLSTTRVAVQASMHHMIW